MPPVLMRDHRYPSVEHAYQAQRTKKPRLFSDKGVFGDIKRGMRVIWPKKPIEGKCSFWLEDRGMPGVVAREGAPATGHVSRTHTYEEVGCPPKTTGEGRLVRAVARLRSLYWCRMASQRG